MVSCGMDHSVKIWRLDKPILLTALAQSHTPCSKKSSDKSAFSSSSSSCVNNNFCAVSCLFVFILLFILFVFDLVNI